MSRVAAQQVESRFREKFPSSASLYERAIELFPSGVTHDSRFLKPFPVYVDQAVGSHKTDRDGNDLIDYWVGHGALLLGHSHPAVVEAVQQQVGRSTHPGACHELELEWGERVQQLVPSAERMRFTNSGTEATLMALRVTRIVTGRTKVLKFAGHFHGWHDQLIPAASPPHDDSGYATPGVTEGVFGDLVIVPPNDLEAAAAAIQEHRPACVIHEGNGARWGVVPARAEFLQGLRQLTADNDTLLILDEVITGFRVHPGGFQAHCDIVPDMTTMAKVLAGGLPGGCLAGRADLLDVLAFGNPLGKKMKHPGTFNANPLSAAAGRAALEVVATGEPSRIASERAAALRQGLNEVFAARGVGWVAYGDFSAIKIIPGYDGPARDGDDWIPHDGDYRRLDVKFDDDLGHAFRCALLLQGVDWMGWAGSTSAAHTDEDVDATVDAFARAIDLLVADGMIAE
ncbi:MAG: aspartate aminotransferase family protein [Planctomycetaceae bacterium]|mgnify:CR=1 FL=1|jgi:glutamate-1-semialdehyde 2,1-aminomutase|nr:aspartate aminotransferase family protein [Planctomycetaceae bacterium]